MNSRFQDVQTRTFDLDHEQLLVLQDRRGARVDVLLGGVWLTEERQFQDRFALAGQDMGLNSGGRAVLEAIGRSRIRVTEPVRGVRAAWRQAMARRRRRIDALMPRALAALLTVVLSLGLPEVMGRSAHGSSVAAHQAVRA